MNLITNLKKKNMGTSNQLSIKQIICFNIIAAEKVAGDVCQVAGDVCQVGERIYIS